MGNNTEDGLIARFLIAHCERSGNGAERAPDPLAIGNYETLIKALVDLKPKHDPEIFIFSEQAQKYRYAVRDLAQCVQDLPSTSDALKAHLNKWEAAFCRLALVYHIIEEVAAGRYPRPEIPEQTAKMAATLMTEFLLPNSIRFYTETIDDGSQGKHARWVAGYILAEGLQVIKKRDLQRVHKPLAHNPKLLTTTMAALYIANWVEATTVKPDGSVTAWTINPAVHHKFSSRAKTERECRAAERAKVQRAVERIRNGRRSNR